MDKKNKAQSRGSGVDQHIAVANRVVSSLEKRIEKFEEKLTKLQVEINEMKQQHTELINLLKEQLGKR